MVTKDKNGYYRWLMSGVLIPCFIVLLGWAMTSVFATQSSVSKSIEEAEKNFIMKFDKIEEEVLKGLNKINEAQLEIVKKFGDVNTKVEVLKSRVDKDEKYLEEHIRLDTN